MYISNCASHRVGLKPSWCKRTKNLQGQIGEDVLFIPVAKVIQSEPKNKCNLCPNNIRFHTNELN